MWAVYNLMFWRYRTFKLPNLFQRLTCIYVCIELLLNTLMVLEHAQPVYHNPMPQCLYHPCMLLFCQ